MNETNNHFLEVETVEEANRINMDVWSFIGIRHDSYCFKKRVRK
jgi:hypothetical protein